MFAYIRRCWNSVFHKISETEKEAILNIKIMHEKYHGLCEKYPKCSKPEKIIQEIIVKKGFPFCKEYSFKDLIGTKQPLRFDFAIIYYNRLTLIEYQGAQHYVFPNKYHKTKEEFDIQVERDQRKKEYCKKHEIRFIEFNYLQDNILQELMNEYFP